MHRGSYCNSLCVLAGVLSMDVVCFVWDQCLIGVDVPGYQSLLHFTAAWLIVLRERLHRCHSVRLFVLCRGLIIAMYQARIQDWSEGGAQMESK